VAATLRRATPEDAADRQPLESPDGSLVLVGDLRLDNRAELAASLGLTDDESVSDSVFALAAYERWGDALPDRIIGEFALAVVDRRRGGILLARDHGGMRPLVIHERRGVLAFASTALALSALEGVGPGLDVTRAAESLALLPRSERTFVVGISWLPPATALWIGSSGARRWTWWKADAWKEADLGSPTAHERELREALDRSVAARLRSSGAVGASTSGGLDSTSVTATAARLMAPAPLHTYTAAPPPGWSGEERPGTDADETPLVHKLAELHPSIRPTVVHLPREGSLFAWHESLWELGSGPVPHIFNWLWLGAIRARANTDGVTTLLSGARGNLYFSADGPRWLISLVRSGRLAMAWRETGAWAQATGGSRLGTLKAHLLRPLLPGRARHAMETWTASTALRPEVAAGLDLTENLPLLDSSRALDMRKARRWMTQRFAQQADAEAAFAALTGVEERDPTADRRLLEVALRQPEWVRRHDGISRAVARGAMADRLPAEIIQRTRLGAQAPDWLDVMTAFRSELTSELDACKQHAMSRELIDTERLQGLVDRWPDRRAAADARVVLEYRLALPRALLVSRYLRWFERRAAATSPPT
jgi:asparagine synthase (glutamine-hydrolysing)